MCECSKTIFNNGASIAAIISCILSYIAIRQTSKTIKQNKKQMELSNKQSLFNRRLKIYIIFTIIYKSYLGNRNLLEDTNDDLLVVDVAFISLTNNTYLENIQGIIENTKNNDLKRQFLYKISELNEIATESELIFEKDCKKDIKEFINDFSNLLLEIYKYQVLLDDIKDWQKKYFNKTSKEFKKQFKKSNHRKELISSFEKIGKTYEKIENNQIIEKIKKQIEL